MTMTTTELKPIPFASPASPAPPSAPAASPVFHLHIQSADLSGVTGHHTIHVQIIEHRSDGEVIGGIPETYGIESDALQRKFNGDVLAWRDWVAAEMLDKHRKRMLGHAEIMQWTGKKYKIEIIP